MMQKKVVPFLVLFMTISLLGIILIQYRWIRNTLNEKQNLINNQVHVILSNIEEQLDDLKGVELINTRVNIPALIESFDSSEYTSSYVFRSDIDSLTAVSMEVMNGIDHKLRIDVTDEIIDLDGDIVSNVDHELHQIIKLIRKVDIEKSSDQNDIRFDSLSVSKVLKKEFLALNNADVINWGLFDNANQTYRIIPENAKGISHQKNLFSTDLLAPNRYQLQVDINTNQMVWREIKLMIVLSILFLSIIVFVFAFSIRLLLKHKKISEIKSDFINNMTHEFKTPLSSISLAADTIIHPSTKKNESTLKHYVNIIQTERKKLNHHVEKILEVGALKKDVLEIELSSVDLNDILRLAIQDLELISAKSGADIMVAQAPETQVIANPEHLKNLFVNIIENAIKYSPKKPCISIRVSLLQGLASVKIIDKGIGMTPNALKHIFKDFYRVQSGNIHQTKGFGLGLSYCQLIIEKMGGTIDIKSQFNEGTEVDIKLKTR